ncbi:hypothetical protein NFJ02_16g23360 [Pycnococcus provasolii]
MLLRVLYGQSDAGRSFWLHLEETLLQEYTRSDADPCTFFKGSLAAGTLIVISTHVDDGPIFAQKESDIDDLVTLLKTTFDRVKLERSPGELLGMQLDYLPDGGIRLHQEKYAKMLMERFAKDIASQRKAQTPATDVNAANEIPLGATQMHAFRSKVGCLLYLAPPGSGAFLQRRCRCKWRLKCSTITYDVVTGCSPSPINMPSSMSRSTWLLLSCTVFTTSGTSSW